MAARSRCEKDGGFPDASRTCVDAASLDAKRRTPPWRQHSGVLRRGGPCAAGGRLRTGFGRGIGLCSGGKRRRH